LPGIKEALGDAALYAERDDLAGWIRHVRLLTEDADFYHERSRATERRVEILTYRDELGPLAEQHIAIVRGRRGASP
jgi:hypothetical protein